MSQEKVSIYRSYWIVIPLALLVIGIAFSGVLLRLLGNLIVADEKTSPADAIVVLNTGIEYYPRLIQAADLYRQGLAANVVINGNRKTDTLRNLDSNGFKKCCPWYADSVAILTMLGVP